MINLILGNHQWLLTGQNNFKFISTLFVLISLRINISSYTMYSIIFSIAFTKEVLRKCLILVKNTIHPSTIGIQPPICFPKC